MKIVHEGIFFRVDGSFYAKRFYRLYENGCLDIFYGSYPIFKFGELNLSEDIDLQLIEKTAEELIQFIVKNPLATGLKLTYISRKKVVKLIFDCATDCKEFISAVAIVNNRQSNLRTLVEKVSEGDTANNWQVSAIRSYKGVTAKPTKTRRSTVFNGKNKGIQDTFAAKVDVFDSVCGQWLPKRLLLKPNVLILDSVNSSNSNQAVEQQVN